MRNSEIMKSIMRRNIFKNKQIPRSIVKFIFIDVMNYFCRFKKSVKLFFTNQSALFYISFFCSKGMLRNPSMIIAASNYFASSPRRMQTTSHYSFVTFTQILTMFRRHFFTFIPSRLTSLGNAITFFRTIQCFFFSVIMNIERLFAYYTILINTNFSSDINFMSFCKRHNYLQIKKAPFGDLEKTIKFSHLLRALNKTKKSLSLSTFILPQGAI